MKRSALNHTKTKRLMRLLDVPQYVAVGILESLWHLTAREAFLGNIGKLSDEDIAIAIDWRGEPEVLINALVTAVFLDRCDEHRLHVHDWMDHADDATKKAIERHVKKYPDTVVKCPTTSDKNRLPLPLPEPEPEPEPEPPAAPDVPLVFDHDMVATAVMAETGTGGMKLRVLLAEIALNAIAAGRKGEEVRDHILAQWRLFQRDMPKLEWQWGSLEKFLQSGLWHDVKLWPWKDGHGPPKAASTRDPLAEVKAQRERAERERDRARSPG